MKEKGGMGFVSSGHLRKATFQQPDLCNRTPVQAQTPACWMNAEGPHPKDLHRQNIHVQSTPLGFPGAPVLKNPAASAGDMKRPGFDPWAGKILWRRSWQPTPVFWRILENPHAQRSVVGCSPWGPTESDTTEATLQAHVHRPH